MSAPAAMQADYTDLRFVKGRKVIQVVLELPIEAGAQFVSVFGTPNPATSVPVAIARINGNAKPEAPAEKTKRPWGELSIAQQAGILCGEKRFQVFVGEQMAKTRGAGFRQDLVSVDDAAWYVRSVCGVNSRAHIERDAEATRKFRDLETNYQVWQTVPA